MENVSSSNRLEKCPKLRFTGFTEPWRTTQLCNLFKKNTQKNSSGAVTNVISNSAKNGLIPQKDYFDKDIANADNTAGYYVIIKNDFVYNPRKSSDAPYGPISRYTYDDDGIVSPLYLCFRSKDVNPEYFEKYFRSTAWHRYIYMYGDNGARHDRVSIKDEIFFEMPVHLPCNEEQEKIATFLSLLEQKIELQRVLVDNLKKYKRGVIQAIFDNETKELLGEISSVKSVRLSELMDFQNGINADASKYGRGVRYISVSDILKNNYITYDKIVGQLDIDNQILEAYSVTYGDVLFQRSSETREDAGRSNVYLDTEKTATFGGFVIRGKKKSDYEPLYLKYALDSFGVRKQIMQCAAGAQHINVSQEDLANIVTVLPAAGIQKRISQFISSIDTRISIEEKKISAHIKLKKALLQQLFI